MLPLFQREVPPALKQYWDAQFSFVSDLSKKIFDSAAHIDQLNMHIAQSAFESAINHVRQMAQSNTPAEYLSLAFSQMQPAAETLRAYRQHVSTLAAALQVELSKTAEQHIPETTRTAAAVADEVARRAAEEADKVTQKQRAVFEKLTMPADSSQTQPNGGSQQHRPASAKGSASRHA